MSAKKRRSEDEKNPEDEVASTYRLGRSSAGHYTREERAGFTKLRKFGEFFDRQQQLKNAEGRSEEDRVWIMNPENLQGALIARDFVDNIKLVCFPLSTHRWFKVSTENKLWNESLKTYVMEQYDALEDKVLKIALEMVRNPPVETPDGLRAPFQLLATSMSGFQTEAESRFLFRQQLQDNPDILNAFMDIFRGHAARNGLLTMKSNVRDVRVVGVESRPNEAAENRDFEKRYLFLSKSTFLADIFTQETPSPPTLPMKKPGVMDADGPAKGFNQYSFYFPKDIVDFEYSEVVYDRRHLQSVQMKDGNIRTEIKLAKDTYFSRSFLDEDPYGGLQSIMVEGNRNKDGELLADGSAKYNKLGTQFFQDLDRSMQDDEAPSEAAEAAEQ
jgi:hypothetical protein